MSNTRSPSTIFIVNLTGQTDFTIPFEYLARKFVNLTLLGTTRTPLVLNRDYRFVSKTVVSLNIIPGAEYTQLEIRRSTSATERLVDFHDGSILRAYDLNISQLQTLHVAEEARDSVNSDSISIDDNFNLDARGKRIVNLSYAEAGSDAVPLGQVVEREHSAWQSALKSEAAADRAEDAAELLIMAPDGSQRIVHTPNKASQLAKTLASRIESAIEVNFADYLTATELDTISRAFNTGEQDGEPIVDVTAKLRQAIDDLGGTHDMTSAFLYSPVKVLRLPAGTMGVRLAGAERILIEKNGIVIVGAGMFMTRLVHMRESGQATEFIRFKEAFACGLSHLTIDCGMGFRPTGAENYGVDFGVILDQVAHFYSVGLNIVNYRYRGLQCIHLWESYFDDLRIFNGGYARGFNTGVPGGLFFSDDKKESTFFPGSESNQVYVGKYAFNGPGAVYRFESPCFNIRFNNVVAEGKTYSSGIPAGVNASKVYVSGLSAGIVVDHAWYYFHDQPFSSAAEQSVLFELANAGPGCAFRNQVVYQEIPIGSEANRLEVSTLVSNASAYPVEVDLVVDDQRCATRFGDSAPGAMLTGSIRYRNTSARTIEDLLGNMKSNFVGTVTFQSGAFSNTPATIYNVGGGSVSMFTAGGSLYKEVGKIIGLATFNGLNGVTIRVAKGVTIARTAAGQYTCTLDVPVTNGEYTVNLDIVKQSSTTDSAELGSISPGAFTFSIRGASGAFVDSSLISLQVVM